MKTTLEIDEAKLLRIMDLTGLKTRKNAVNFALDVAEQHARLQRNLNDPFYVAPPEAPLLAAGYDVLELRTLDRPR